MKTAYIDWLLSDKAHELDVIVSGAERGFNERADVIRAADGTDLNEFWNEVQDTIQMRNADRSRLIDALTYRVTGPTEEVSVPSEFEFEEASEFGQPVGHRAAAMRMFRGYDFKFYDLAIRYTWMFIAEATRDQLQMQHNMALEADTKLIFKRVMNRLFKPTNSDGITDNNEPITAFGFYNADGEVPPPNRGNTFDSSHTHYTTTGNTAATSANVDQLATQLQEHGYTMAAGYRLVLWVNRQEADRIRNFKVANGDKFDFVPDANLSNGAIWVPEAGRYEGGPQGTVEGQIGTYGPFHVVEEDYIPAGYMVALATGGQDNIANPIGLREHSNPSYRGLKIIPGQRSDYPLLDSFYRRGIGTGVRHRGAGAVMQVSSGSQYQIPAEYAN